MGEDVEDADTNDQFATIHTNTRADKRHARKDFFKLFLDDSVIDVIVSQTNLFADQFLSSHDIRTFYRARAQIQINIQCNQYTMQSQSHYTRYAHNHT